MPTNNNNKDSKGGRHSSSSSRTTVAVASTSEESDFDAAAVSTTTASTSTMGRSVVGTKKNDGKKVDRFTSTSPPVDADANVTAAAAGAKPGAVAVHGQPSYLGADDVDVEGAAAAVDGTSSPPPPAPRHPRAAAASSDSPAVAIDSSYVVVASEVPMTTRSNEEVVDDEEEIRRRILANTEHAEQVTDFDSLKTANSQRSQQQCWFVAAIVALLIVVVAIAVGIAVPLSRNASSASGSGGAASASDNTDDFTSPIHDPSVVAALSYIEWQGSGGFAYSVRAETRQTNVLGDTTTTTTSGVVEIVGCKPKPCTTSDDACIVGKFYDPGCCAGSNCTNNATKCGDSCRPAPTSCYLTDPSNRTCLQPDCYTCHKVNGQDIYELQNIAFAIDCLQVGTSIRADNNETYEWAIFCGPMIAGPIVEENRALGQYQCGAFRQGANYSDDPGGLGMEAANYPCVYLALAQCGCGPSNMYTFGLPPPTGPCEPMGGGGNRTCPLLCEDVGVSYAQDLCHSFPGNISYWDGANAFNSTLFYEGLMAPEYQLDIYIKDESSNT